MTVNAYVESEISGTSKWKAAYRAQKEHSLYSPMLQVQPSPGCRPTETPGTSHHPTLHRLQEPGSWRLAAGWGCVAGQLSVSLERKVTAAKEACSSPRLKRGEQGGEDSKLNDAQLSAPPARQEYRRQ